MGAFDPDAYLAKPAPASASGAFDPDAYLSRPSGVSNQEAALGKSTAKAQRELGLIEQAASLPLTAATVITGGPAALAGMWGEALGSKETGAAIRKALTFPTYTEAQQRQLEALGGAMEAAHLPPTLGGAGIPLNALAGPATTQGVNAFGKAAQPVVQAVKQPLAQRAARIAEEQSAADWARAPKIEAAQAAQRLGVAINPAQANPNVKTKLLVGATGEAVVNEKAAKSNLPRWNEIAREDMGLPENTPLNAQAFEKAREAHSGPYEKIRQLGTLAPDEDVIGQIEKLKLDPLSTSNPEKAAKVNGIVDRVVGQVSEGLSGNNVVGQIRDFRKDANRTLKNPNASPIDIDAAEAQLGIANALENLVENNIRDPKALSEFRAARTALAKTYDWERVTGVTTKQVDPLEVAKLAEKGKPLSGALKDVADVAGNFPDIASTTGNKEQLLYQRLRRGGAGGTIGFALGGGPVGAAVGAGITSLGSEAAANMLARPGMQNRLAIPADRRIPLAQATAPEAAPIPRANALTPYDYSQQTFESPNFVLRPNEYPPKATFVGPEMGTPQLQAPSAERTMAAVAAERQRQYNIDKALYESTAEREAARAAGTPMQRAAFNLEKGSTTRGRGSVIDIDPVTGKMTLGAEATANMTPDIQVIENTAKSLESAARKMAGGMVSETIQGIPQTATRQAQAFALTAEERIAWNKAKTDLAEVMPGFKSLDDKVLAERMMDRKWVADALEKSRQKAALFDDIAKRAADQQAKMEAAAKREQLLDLADLLEENLRGGRPVSKGGQGPKTRAHQRNMLAPESDVQNSLRIELRGMANKE